MYVKVALNMKGVTLNNKIEIFGKSNMEGVGIVHKRTLDLVICNSTIDIRYVDF